MLTVTSLSSQALAIPGDGMSREEQTSQVDLPDIPKSTELEGDETPEQKELTTAQEVPVTPYVPKNVTPWVADLGTATLTETSAPGTTVPLSANLPIAIGVPEGGDPAAVDGQWSVDLKPVEASQDAG
ncbi:hypothetical protein, partial [Streptomyces sp. NPDC053755]|uniref:hypothetical protein n=1 Tax=Streptomyces sp. NPDC053755 TaxID=3155815 RepID=UPI0034403378